MVYDKNHQKMPSWCLRLPLYTHHSNFNPIANNRWSLDHISTNFHSSIQIFTMSTDEFL